MLSNGDKKLILEKYQMYFAFHTFLLIEHAKILNKNKPKHKSTVEIEEIVESSVLVPGGQVGFPIVNAGSDGILPYIFEALGNTNGEIVASSGLLLLGELAGTNPLITTGFAITMKLVAMGAATFAVSQGTVAISDAKDQEKIKKERLDANVNTIPLNDQLDSLAYPINVDMKGMVVSSIKGLSEQQLIEVKQTAEETCDYTYGKKTFLECFDSYEKNNKLFYEHIKLTVLQIDPSVKESDFNDPNFAFKYLTENLSMDENGKKSLIWNSMEDLFQKIDDGIVNDPSLKFLTDGKIISSIESDLNKAVAVLNKGPKSLQEDYLILKDSLNNTISAIIKTHEFRKWALRVTKKNENPMESFANDLFKNNELIEEIVDMYPEEMRAWSRQFLNSFIVKNFVMSNGDINKETLIYFLEISINERKVFYREFIVENLRTMNKKVEDTADEFWNNKSIWFYFITGITALFLRGIIVSENGVDNLGKILSPLKNLIKSIFKFIKNIFVSMPKSTRKEVISELNKRVVRESPFQTVKKSYDGIQLVDLTLSDTIKKLNNLVLSANKGDITTSDSRNYFNLIPLILNTLEGRQKNNSYSTMLLAGCKRILDSQELSKNSQNSTIMFIKDYNKKYGKGI